MTRPEFVAYCFVLGCVVVTGCCVAPSWWDRRAFRRAICEQAAEEFVREVRAEVAELRRQKARSSQVQALAEAYGTGHLEELWQLPAAGQPYDHRIDGL